MAQAGMRYLEPCKGAGQKTGRRYAMVMSIARAVASKGKPFTRMDLPGLTANQATLALYYLWRKGELVRLKAGRPGRGMVPGIYQLER